ncbi:MAG: hypothetical protein U9R06_01125 [Patescibacteria group bacterium]|nr:hypothetical protein [Patescibacteria group bacterium]
MFDNSGNKQGDNQGGKKNNPDDFSQPLTGEKNKAAWPAAEAGNNNSMNTEAPAAKERIKDILAETDEIKKTPEKPAAFQPKQESADRILEAEAASSDNTGHKFKKIFVLLMLACVLVLISVAVFWIYGRFFNNPDNNTGAQINDEPDIIKPVEDSNVADEAPAQQPSAQIKEESPAYKIIDTDEDGLSDSEEMQLGTNVNDADTDNDGLFDLEEVKTYKTDPLNPDTDGDGFLDGAEVKDGYNPNGAGELYKLEP